MNNFSKLIKSRIISFNDAMIDSYSELQLDEVDAMILIHLHAQLGVNNNILSINHLTAKMTISEDDLSNRVLALVQKGFLELLINNDNNETFSLDETYNKLGSVIDEEERHKPKTRSEMAKQIVKYIEATLQISLRSNDLELVNAWIDEQYTFEEIKNATLDCLKNGKPYVHYIDKKLISNAPVQPIAPLDERTFNLLNKIYVKSRG